MKARISALALLALACAGGPSPAPPPPPSPPPAAPAQRVPERFAEAVAYSAERGGRVLLVVEHGRVVLETGQAGADPQAPHPLFGASESFWGVVAVAAAQDGLLDLDESVAETLPELPAASEIRLEQLLHFTSGLESGANAPGGVLGLEMVSKPGERFQYGPSHLRVFAEVLRRKLERSGAEPDPVRYLEGRILEPIGAHLAGWERDAQGHADPSQGASITARDWARFGALLLGRGRYGDTRVVEEERIQECFVGSRANPSFGLALWLNTPSRRLIGARWGGREPRPPFYPAGLPGLVAATGADNQRLYVMPSLDSVVVRFGARDRRFRDEDFLGLLVAAVAAERPAGSASLGPHANEEAPPPATGEDR